MPAELQVAEWLMLLGVPRGKASHLLNPVKLWLVTATEASPVFSTTARRRAAMSSRASSQETSLKSPSPRSPVRFKGFLRRSGWFQIHMVAAARPQYPR